MKKNLAFTILSLLLFSATSCVVLVPAQHHDNGKHKGWYKSPNNPHNSSPKKDKENQGQNQNKTKGNNKKH